MRYSLMNKDTKLLDFETVENLGTTTVREIKSYSELRPIGFKDISDWVSNRNYAKHKRHLKEWLREWGIDTLDGFLQISHALGINDTLWVKDEDSDLKWKKVSLYSNPFTDVISKTAFDSGLHGLKLKTTSPEFTCEGSFLKYWTYDTDGIFLYKFGATGASNVGNEPHSEYLSACVSKELYKNTVSYDLEKQKGKLCSRCRLFTDEQEGFVPMYRFLQDRTYNLVDLLKICSDMGYEDDFRKMILVDSVTFNQDRHLGNFGFIINNDTFEIKRFAPLFDFNQSMLCNAMDNDLNDFDSYVENYGVEHKLGGRFAKVGRAILTKEMKKDMPDGMELRQHPLYPVEETRFGKINEIFKRNYEEIMGNPKLFLLNQE